MLYSSKLLAAAIMVSDTPSQKAVSHRLNACETRQKPFPITCSYFLQNKKCVRSSDNDIVQTDCQCCPTRVTDLLLNIIYHKLTCKIGISHIHFPGKSNLLLCYAVLFSKQSPTFRRIVLSSYTCSRYPVKLKAQKFWKT